jgi:hypothetical protein
LIDQKMEQAGAKLRDAFLRSTRTETWRAIARTELHAV